MITDRIKQIIENEKISVRVFEEKLGVSQGSINKAINLGGDLKVNTLNKIVDLFPQYNPMWILTGNGEMLKNSNEVEINSTAKEPEAKYTTCASCKSKDKLITTLEHKTVRDEEQIERLWKQIEYLTKTKI